MLTVAKQTPERLEELACVLEDVAHAEPDDDGQRGFTEASAALRKLAAIETVAAQVPETSEMRRRTALEVVGKAGFRHASRCYYLRSSEEDGDEPARCDCGKIEAEGVIVIEIEALLCARDEQAAARHVRAVAEAVEAERKRWREALMGADEIIGEMDLSTVPLKWQKNAKERNELVYRLRVLLAGEPSGTNAPPSRGVEPKLVNPHKLNEAVRELTDGRISPDEFMRRVRALDAAVGNAPQSNRPAVVEPRTLRLAEFVTALDTAIASSNEVAGPEGFADWLAEAGIDEAAYLQAVADADDVRHEAGATSDKSLICKPSAAKPEGGSA